MLSTKGNNCYFMKEKPNNTIYFDKKSGKFSQAIGKNKSCSKVRQHVQYKLQKPPHVTSMAPRLEFSLTNTVHNLLSELCHYLVTLHDFE